MKTENAMQTMPVFFLAHGSPMNALDSNHFTQDWHNITASLKKFPKPKAIVCLSAHWHVPGTWVTANTKPPTIHDFGGFPQALFDCQYPCPGNPELADEICQLLNLDLIQSHDHAQTTEQWGLDHGTWVILKHLHPDASIPVLQISLDNRTNDCSYHYQLAQKLKPLREQGVLFIGSGNIVHNIPKWMTMKPGEPTDWAVKFDAAIRDAIDQNHFETVRDYLSLDYAAEAVPTIEHFLPLVYCLGLAGDENFSWQESQVQHSDFGFEDLSTACSRSIAFA